MTFFLTKGFYALMKFMYGLFNNSYLWTIIVATVLLRLIQIFPDISNRRTQIKMAKVQPELNALQKKYEKDPQKLREEQSKLMKKHGVSTLSSCLPLLITLPLFFCFLNAFRCWGNEETITLMYETAVAESLPEGSAERTAAEEHAMETFKGFKFLWVNNIWQPDNFIDANLLLIRMDGEVITKPRSLTALSSNTLANMPLLKKGYTYTGPDGQPKTVSGEEIWATLTEAGLASGNYDDAGSSKGCSCAGDTSGMHLLPESVSTDFALGAVDESAKVTGDDGKTTVKGSDVYSAIMKRYPEALSKNGKTPANGLMILPFLAAGMQLLTSIIMMRRNKKDGQNNPQAKSMNSMMYIMPIISIFICMSSTTAFAFYWTISGAFQLVSTIIINAVFAKKAKADEANA